MANCDKRFKIYVDLLAYAVTPDYWRKTINTFQRKEVFANFLKGLLSPVKYTNDLLVAKCKELERFLGYTGQVGSLEIMLNDYLDPLDRGITIELLTIFRSKGLDVQKNNEGRVRIKNLVRKNNETGKYQFSVYKNGESRLDQPFGFKVIIPIGLTLQDYQINTLLRNYVPAGVSWYIERL